MGTLSPKNQEHVKPSASVIIAGYYSSSTLAITLDSLAEQSCQDFETIFINSSQEVESEKIIKLHFPWVRFHQHPHRLLMHEARNQGAAKARGDLLIFSDPDIRIHPKWVEKMLASFHSGARCMVGEMDSQSTNWVGVGIHLVKFHEHLAGIRVAPQIAPTASAAYDRSLFEQIGGFEGTKVCGDAIISWQVRELGIPIVRVKNVAVQHIHDHTMSRLIRERKNRGKEFIVERMSFENWNIYKIFFHILLFPAAVIYVCLIAGNNARRAGWFWRYLKTFPVQLLGQSAWCWGECLGQIKTLRGRV
jgi:GT2 family glycosyltransferase